MNVNELRRERAAVNQRVQALAQIEVAVRRCRSSNRPNSTNSVRNSAN
ncbi:hypothetical protein C7S17_0002 [Burkholderia thailandensis]|nr:hypothetical protein [Burkholderia thailandensis]